MEVYATLPPLKPGCLATKLAGKGPVQLEASQEPLEYPVLPPEALAPNTAPPYP